MIRIKKIEILLVLLKKLGLRGCNKNVLLHSLFLMEIKRRIRGNGQLKVIEQKKLIDKVVVTNL